jgi:hypothetical protein
MNKSKLDEDFAWEEVPSPAVMELDDNRRRTELNEILIEEIRGRAHKIAIKNTKSPSTNPKNPYNIYKEKKQAGSWKNVYSVDPFDSFSHKEELTLEECMEMYLELEKKGIADICLTGSAALALQGKISRTSFKDLDIIAEGEIQLDDDLTDYKLGDYPKDNSIVDHKSLLFMDGRVDLFVKDKLPETIEIDYNGAKIKCSHYKNIIEAKLRMALNSFKDKEDLIGRVVEINIK